MSFLDRMASAAMEQEFEATLKQDISMQKSAEEIEQRCDRYPPGTFLWALWCLEKGEAIEL